MRKLTHLTSSSSFSSSSFWKSSLLTTSPPVLSLQPLVFQFFTQLVIPSWSKNTRDDMRCTCKCNYIYKQEYYVSSRTCGNFIRSLKELLGQGIEYTINGELAVCVENQLLDVHFNGLFQCPAGCLNQM